MQPVATHPDASWSFRCLRGTCFLGQRTCFKKQCSSMVQRSFPPQTANPKRDSIFRKSPLKGTIRAKSSSSMVVGRDFAQSRASVLRTKGVNLRSGMMRADEGRGESLTGTASDARTSMMKSAHSWSSAQQPALLEQWLQARDTFNLARR